jgi:DNA-binding Lrp family transcriptional regulator
MAITFTGSSGSGAFFMRIGRLFQLAKVHNAFRDDVVTEIDDVDDEFTTADSDHIASLVEGRDAFSQGLATLDREISRTAHRIVMETIRDGLGLSPSTLSEAMTLLVKDMKRQGVYVEENTISAGTLSAGLDGLTNTSNVGTVLISNHAPEWMAGGPSKKRQNIRAETMRIECTKDASYGPEPGRELFTITGSRKYSNYDPNWPSGSAANTNIPVTASDNYSAVSGRRNAATTGTNLLRNSGFDRWSDATTLNQFTLGGSGTDLATTNGGEGGALSDNAQRTTTTFGSRGTYNLQFNGNNSYKHTAFQRMGHTDGTTSRVYSGRSYVYSINLRAVTTTITSGVIRLALWNGTSSRLSASSLSLDFSSTNITTSWTNLTGVIDLSEKVVPQDLRFAIDFSTALQADRSLIVGELILAEPTQLYDGGPSIVITRGENDFRLRDGFTLAYTNNYGSEMQTFFNQYVMGGNMMLPVAGSTLVADGTYIA